MMLIGWPDEEAEKNVFSIDIPGVTSLMVGGKFDTEIQGLKAFPRNERPPVAASFWSFHLMIYTAMWMTLIAFIGLVYGLKNH